MMKTEIKDLIRTNLKIFKENVRTILSFSADFIYEQITKEEYLNNIILKRLNKGKCEEIEELEAEQQKSSFNSALYLNDVG